MATYPVVNTKTGEQKDVVMSVNDWDQWREDIILIGKDTTPDPLQCSRCWRSWRVER